ncbi:Delta 8-(E)-sphingolipid desaturase [Sphaceloma murrayae]|uniref:Delta 8-(E)-sphingolipid desaturase n=1 Tax=Sphaceloma murrayae TaxID=2082308 RepID=A0A2K1R2Y7_9PEZI|nr:Delta 8-(E)-sphingolipid desaturase [Sphaceloma murrayae]
MEHIVVRKDRIFTRDEVEAQIADGRLIFILDGDVIKADAWRKYHPGGDKAILHMVGRDATDEVTALHSPEARERMKRFVVGRVEGRWENFVPPIQGGTFRSQEELQATGSVEMVAADDTDSSSQNSSATSSPVFDAVDSDGVRKRRKGTQGYRLSNSSSATSISTMDMTPKSDRLENPMTERSREQIEEDLRKYPKLDTATQQDIIIKYRDLNQRIRAAGLYNCNYSAYAREVVRYVFLFSMCMLTLRWGWYATSGLFLGCFWHQLVFTAHDAGHMGITHNFHVDTVIGIIIADYLGGLSLGWWKRNHNVHHIVTNSPEHDPDIEHMPFFAISHRFFESLRSTYYDRVMTYDPFAKFMIRYQNYLYYPVLTMGRFNLYRLSWEYLILGQGPRKGPAWWHRWFEIAGQVFFWTWFGYGVLYKGIPTAWGRFVFVMVSHMVTMPLHVQITLSHFAMSTADLGVKESFPQRMLRTTMDVDCPQWLDFFHGGLQFQAIHHLYPRIPRHNLRQTQKMVQQFCNEVGIPYALYGFVEGNKEVIGRLGDVAKQARILAECQKHIAESGDLHQH